MSTSSKEPASSTWEPHIKLDISVASNKAFAAAVDEFDAWRASQPERTLDLSNGWKVITPEIAEAMLMRNPAKGNRRPTLPTIKRYANQMLRGDWIKTGQALIFTKTGRLVDAGHRLWAGYLSGATFESYVIGDVEENKYLFAYIDNGKTRTATDALRTADLNGLSALLTRVVNMAVRYENDRYTAKRALSIDRMNPVEVINYVTDHPKMREAASLMLSEHKSATSIIVFEDVAAFAGFKILELYGESVFSNFMEELDKPVPEEDTRSPILALQKALDTNKFSKQPMERHDVLACVIKAFNAWINDEPMTSRKVYLLPNDDFPKFQVPQALMEAAQ